MNIKSKIRLYSLLLISAGCVSASISNYTNIVQTNATYSVTENISEYYNSVNESSTGTALLSELRSLNSVKRRSTVGYSSMGTSPSGMYKYTDYDPNTVKYDSNNQPYGTAIISFYSDNSTTSWNREHVWPNSHGGNVVENDIHMPRPTIPSENGSRGNSFYVEGMKSSTNGWDPASESFGVESYRGDSARIVFYCVIANSQLSLLDTNYSQTSNSNKDYKMGKLSDLLKWNLEYPVLDREYRRNDGAEYLQGNRNPFIDHPEYACKIWGDTNETTRRICASSATKLESLSINSTNVSLVYGDTYQLKVTANPSNASSSVKWSSSDATIASVDTNGLVTAKSKVGSCTITATSNADSSIKVTSTINVKEPTKISLESISSNDINISVGETSNIDVYYNPSNVYPKPTSFQYDVEDNNIVSVSNHKVTGLKIGETKITITVKQDGITKSTTINVKVNEATDVSDELVPSLFGTYGTATEYATSSGLKLKATQVGNYSNSIQFKKNAGVLWNSESINLKKITIEGTNTLSVYGSTSENSKENEILPNNGAYDLSGYKYFVIANENGSVDRASKITITFSKGGSVTPIEKQLLNLEVVGSLNKTQYFVGEKIDLTGLKIYAHFSDNSTADVTNEVTLSIDKLSLEDTSFDITYTYKEVSKTATIAGIKVVEKPIEKITLIEIRIEGSTNDIKLNQDGSLDLSKVKIIATFSNGTTKDITNEINSNNISINGKNVTISYTYEGITKITSFNMVDSNVVDDDNKENDNNNSGCQGNVYLTSGLLSLLALSFVVILVIKKYKEN